jgi:DNA mismatch repair protein MutS2
MIMSNKQSSNHKTKVNAFTFLCVVLFAGPNTGGKTAAMKAFGLAACMAKAGMLLPAQAPARLPCFSCVLAEIGDEQSLTANLSTFSGHIKR